MSNLKCGFVSNISMITFAVVCASTQLTGCVSTLESITQTSNTTAQTDSDIIRHIGVPSYQGVRQKGMVLLADQHSYLISNGDELLEQLTSLDSRYLQIERPVLIQAYPDNTVSIQLNFRYSNLDSGQTGASRLNTQQQNLLSKLCQPDANSAYANCQLKLEGGMYQPVSLSNSTTQAKVIANDGLQGGLPAQIQYLNKKRAKNQAEVGVIPMSVVVDTLTLPLQILLIGKAFDGL